MPDPETEAPRIVPTFRYRDAAAMVDWLVKAFGFAVLARYAEEDGSVGHAELTYGSAMIMLGAVRDDDFGRLVGDPGGSGTATYIAVDDVDAVFARAEAAGARIEEGLTERDYGSREFICRDPEGYLWCFGTYWPKATGND